VDEAKVFARVASADSGTSGGGTENLERAERRRDESNEEAKKAKAELVARQLAYGKIEAALQAARADVDKKELAFEATRDSLHEADHRYATALFNIKAARLAAKKEQREWKHKEDDAHMAMINSRDELAAVKKQDKKAAAYVDEAKVFARVASADSGTSGGGTENLERAERRRDESNEEAKKAKAELVARQLAYGKIEAALQAARADVDKKELAFEATRDSLHEADHRYATALFNIKAGKKQKMKLEIDLAEAKSHDNDMQREQHVAHGLAHAAVLVAKNDPSGDEVQIKALLEDRDQEVMEAIGSAKDHDGISDDGKPLVAAPGSVAAEYKRRFAALPLPDSGRNPILEAEARADAGGR